MYPELFRIGPVVITSFGAMMVLAFLAGYFQTVWGFKRLGIGDEDDAGAVLFAAGVGGILGSKIYYAALYGDWRLLLDRAGLVWYGGAILGSAAVLWTIRRRRLPLLAVADVILVGTAIGYAIGRIGCFLVGDDYGKPTDVPWGVRFPEAVPPATAGALRQDFPSLVPPDLPPDAIVPVHPTQLYETAMALAIWALGLWLFRRGVRPGGIALALAALLSVERFVVEIFRAKDDRFFGPFTLAQVISVAILGIVALLWARWRRTAAPGASAGAGRAATNP
ncbi:MAG TPA: prolipoprotein diacylglyceryl transferase [Thermoanaerobaculia bacterium]|nr:prolipoprotein diacylglyceryl transferase [Thermoanaerobaculia bacterium]